MFTTKKGNFKKEALDFVKALEKPIKD